jgi:outer membrane protein assembly factor BamB
MVATLSIGFMAPASHAYTVEPAPLAWEPDGPVHDIAVHGNRMYVVGEFTGGIAALDATTGALQWTASADNEVLAVAVSEDGSRVLVGGNFVSVNGIERKRLVAFDASDGTIVDGWRPKASGKVLTIAVDGGVAYVGGRFGSLSSSYQKGIGAVYVSSGQRVLSFSHYVDLPVEALAVGGGRLVLSGRFTSVDGSPRASIASINLSDYGLTSFSPARICPKCSNYKALATDGENAYIGSSGPGGKFAAFDLDTGAQPWPMVLTDGDVQAVSVGFDGYVYIGGHFSQYVRTYANPRTQMASINAATGAVGPFNPVMYNHYPGVLAVTATPDRLYVGGAFSGVQENGESNHERFLAAFAN